MDTLDINECAEFLKIHVSTAAAMAALGNLPGAKIGSAWVFLRSDLVEYLRNEARRQARERQIKATVTAELEESVARTPAMVLPNRKRGGQRRPRPDLSKYDDLPQLSGKVAGSQVAVTP